jgi:hypothetical protein
MTEETQEVEIDPNDEKSLPENILRGLILSYQNGWNKNNDKYEVKYYLTQTFHKVETKEGNKEVAYLRLERAVRDKNFIQDLNLPEEQRPKEWSTQLVCTEMYPMSDIRMKLNPDAAWRQQIYWNMIGRLMQGGLEYAELLQRVQKAKLDEQLPDQPKKLDLEVTNEMPKPLNQSEQEYKEWVKNNNIYAKK